MSRTEPGAPQPPETSAAAAKADGRRTDTRRRIHDVALEVFAEVGYERATLLQIAERLGVTRPALYYHYRNKEDILAAIHAELTLSVDAVIDWSRSQPAGRATRHETLRRLSELLRGPWGTFSRFAQASEAAMRDLSAAEEHSRRMDAIGDILAPTTDSAGRLRGRLALSGLVMAATHGDRLGGAVEQCTDAALGVAFSLTR